MYNKTKSCKYLFSISFNNEFLIILKVSIPDNRLDILAKIANSKQIIKSQIEFVDIAGLVRGASKGEGLGNQFLSNIRYTDVILQCVRCFDDSNVSHVEQTVDPIRDINIIESELILSDIDILERKLSKKSKEKLDNKKRLIFENVLNELYNNKYLYKSDLSEDIKNEISNLQLITNKPIIYICHVNAEDNLNGNKYVEKVKEYIKPSNLIMISPLLEEEASQFEDDESQLEYLQSYGLKQTGLSSIILRCQELLDYIYFFTVGPKESHSWRIRRNKTALDAAGTIHTDFISKFVKAQTISYDDFIKYNGEEGVRKAGKLRTEGKNYIVQDGDIFNFLLS